MVGVVGQEGYGRKPDGAGWCGQEVKMEGMAGCKRTRWQLLGSGG